VPEVRNMGEKTIFRPWMDNILVEKQSTKQYPRPERDNTLLTVYFSCITTSFTPHFNNKTTSVGIVPPSLTSLPH
jgi:hypothetical protein